MSGTLIERAALRYTPAGIPVVEVQLQHRSETVEGGLHRRLEFGFDAMAIGEMAGQLAIQSLGSELAVSGFLAPRGRRSTRLLVHVQEFTRLAEAPEAGASGTGENR